MIDIKRLIKKKAHHDISSRDRALAYIDGDIYMGNTHADCIKQYCDEQELDSGIGRSLRRPDIDKLKSEGVEIAFGHLLDREKKLYIEENSMVNCDIFDVVDVLESDFADYDIYSDDRQEVNQDGQLDYVLIAPSRYK